MLKRKVEDDNYQSDIIRKDVDDLFGDHNVAQSKGQFIIVRWDGKKMRMKSGKSVWAKKGAASNALGCHIGSVPKELRGRFKSKTDYKKYLIEAGHIKIIEVK